MKISKCTNPGIVKLWVNVTCSSVSKRFYFYACHTLCFTLTPFKFPDPLAHYFLVFILPFTHGIMLQLGLESGERIQDGGKN